MSKQTIQRYSRIVTWDDSTMEPTNLGEWVLYDDVVTLLSATSPICGWDHKCVICKQELNCAFGICADCHHIEIARSVQRFIENQSQEQK